ncbi:MAG: hypothetical protein P1U37_07820 [Minwuia sp.]|nr:hypothetical protein [Minwuia sp.]
MISHPLTGLYHWIAMSQQVLNAFNGKGSLAVHELDKAKVQTPHAHIRPFPRSSGNVNFSAWRLAHAIKKADCARWPSSHALWTGSAGFLLENAQLFDWKALEFGLNEGMSKFNADFSGSSLAGRVAQGMALLFLEEQGYAYVGRFETEWKKLAALQGKPWPKDKKKAPDFIAENKENEWVLAESKGGFASHGSKPNIKGALNDGLKQLDGWDAHITPQPSKSFAIGTFLRESGDCSEETSLIAFVDPEPDAPEDPVEFPTDAVRRANYGSWLSVMGFDDAAYRVQIGVGDPQRRSVPVISLGGRDYAVSVLSVSSNWPDLSSREFWLGFDDWRFGPLDSFRHGINVELVGLDLEVLRVLGSVQGSPRIPDLVELKPQERRDAPIDFDGGTFYGSVFSDGSLLGELRQTWTSGSIPDFEWIEVDL